jgi:hypothetical protein
VPGESDSNREEDTPLEQVVSGVVIALIFVVGFGLMFAGVPWFWVAFPVGFAGLLPAAIGLARRYERSQETTATEDERSAEEDALEELKARYARGELTDEEFERRVERLLETESVEDAEAFLGGGGSGSGDGAAADAIESERQPETEVE